MVIVAWKRPPSPRLCSLISLLVFNRFCSRGRLFHAVHNACQCRLASLPGLPILRWTPHNLGCVLSSRGRLALRPPERHSSDAGVCHPCRGASDHRHNAPAPWRVRDARPAAQHRSPSVGRHGAVARRCHRRRVYCYGGDKLYHCCALERLGRSVDELFDLQLRRGQRPAGKRVRSLAGLFAGV